jgi:E3 ubiquitin-protein ligase DOA10
MSLPSKEQYFATLKPAVPSPDDLQCHICRQDYNHLEEEVIQAGPECSLHPFHRECLVPWVDDANPNSCPECKRQLYEVH